MTAVYNPRLNTNACSGAWSISNLNPFPAYDTTPDAFRNVFSSEVVPGAADHWRVFRSTTEDFSDASDISGPITGPNFEDTTAPQDGTPQWWWVIGYNASESEAGQCLGSTYGVSTAYTTTECDGSPWAGAPFDFPDEAYLDTQNPNQIVHFASTVQLTTCPNLSSAIVPPVTNGVAGTQCHVFPTANPSNVINFAGSSVFQSTDLPLPAGRRALWQGYFATELQPGGPLAAPWTRQYVVDGASFVAGPPSGASSFVIVGTIDINNSNNPPGPPFAVPLPPGSPAVVLPAPPASIIKPPEPTPLPCLPCCRSSCGLPTGCTVDVVMVEPAPMLIPKGAAMIGNFIELEDASGVIALENGSGFILLE